MEVCMKKYRSRHYRRLRTHKARPGLESQVYTRVCRAVEWMYRRARELGPITLPYNGKMRLDGLEPTRLVATVNVPRELQSLGFQRVREILSMLQYSVRPGASLASEGGNRWYLELGEVVHGHRRGQWLLFGFAVAKVPDVVSPKVVPPVAG